MHYTCKEIYSFAVPEEYRAYLEFKHRLHDSSVRFTETGGSRFQEIEIFKSAEFNVNENGVEDLRKD